MLPVSRTKLFFSFLIVFLLIAISSNSATGQSRSLYMPVLSTDSADSELTLVNPTLAPATVTLTARSYNGVTLRGDGIINPVTLTLPASSSRALTSRELFGQDRLAGWVELQTATPPVSGAFFLVDSTVTAYDGASLQTATANRLVFPKATTDSAAANSFVLINTSGCATGPVR